MKIDFSDLEKAPEERGQVETTTPQETPTAETQTTEEIQPSAETPQEVQTPQEPTVVENKPEVIEFTESLMFETLSKQLGKEVKSYEDLIQKPVEIDAQVKELNDWSQRTGRPIEDYFKLQKDWSQVSDEEVARRYLQEKFPTFTKKQLDFKMKSFTATEDDLEDDKLAKSVALAEYALEGRKHFNSYQQELSKPSQNILTSEQREQLSYLDQIKAQADAQKLAQQEYMQGLTQASGSLESLKLELEDNFTIDFNLTKEDRDVLPTFINEMPHWRNQDGSFNHEAVARDAAFIKNKGKIIQEVYKQGLNSGISKNQKEINNITLDEPQNRNSMQNSGADKPQIEGFEDLIKRHNPRKR